MLQPYHRGAYEYLWFEHKFSVLGVSVKAFQNATSKIGKLPQIHALLGCLYHYTNDEKKDWYNALLNAYKQLTPHLSRQRKREIVEAILEDHGHAQELIYADTLKFKETTLYGSRVFFPQNLAIYKFWDKEGMHGLWSLFGPFQLYFNTGQIFSRIITQANISAQTFDETLKLLSTGLNIDNFSCIDEPLKTLLMRNNMVSLTGEKARLHPRIPLDYELSQAKCNLAEAAAMAISDIWDTTDQEDLRIPDLPPFDDFSKSFENLENTGIILPKNISVEESYEFAAYSFWDRKQIELGQRKT
jgi:hypothetical protein